MYYQYYTKRCSIPISDMKLENLLKNRLEPFDHTRAIAGENLTILVNYQEFFLTAYGPKRF